MQADVIRGLSSVELVLVAESAAEGQTSVPVAALGSAQMLDDGAIRTAKPLDSQNDPPRYPWLARLRGWEGQAVVRVRVSQGGRPISIHIVGSSGYPVLDSAAVDAIRHWRFHPLRERGRAVASGVDIPVTFRLDQNE